MTRFMGCSYQPIIMTNFLEGGHLGAGISNIPWCRIDTATVVRVDVYAEVGYRNCAEVLEDEP